MVNFEKLGLEVSWCEVSEVNPIFTRLELGIGKFETVVEFEIKGMLITIFI